MLVWNLNLPLLKSLISLILDPLRRRVLVACTRCREKKRRCDGVKPCGSCTGKLLECSYEYIGQLDLLLHMPGDNALDPYPTTSSIEKWSEIGSGEDQIGIHTASSENWSEIGSIPYPASENWSWVGSGEMSLLQNPNLSREEAVIRALPDSQYSLESDNKVDAEDEFYL